MPDKPPSRAQIGQSASESRDRMVKDMIEKERLATDAKTARLKALRLARDAAAPPPPPRKTKRKPAKS